MDQPGVAWFAAITNRRLRRGVFRAVNELIQAIGDFVDEHDEHYVAFTWRGKAKDIIDKVAPARGVLEDKASTE